MIVKDESKVIRRCLSSVKNMIDYWVIVDTGSTDGTQNIIKEYLKEIPGRLVERPWVDFAHNRNEALALARGHGDYFLIIDADDSLVFSEGFAIPDLTKDIYYAVEQVKHGNLVKALLLFKNLPEFRWEGVLHEGIVSDSVKSSELLTGIRSQYGQDGFRSQDPNKYVKDAHVLEQALQSDR